MPRRTQSRRHGRRQRALSRDREARFATADELAAELTAFTTEAVSGTGARVVDWLAGTVGAASVVAFVAAIVLLGTVAGMLSLTGIWGILMLVVSVLGCGLSVSEWITRGRHRLSPLALGLAVGTQYFAVAGFAMGYMDVLGTIALRVGFEDAVAYRQLHTVGMRIALASLAFGSALAAFQLVSWGVARRRAQRAE